MARQAPARIRGKLELSRIGGVGFGRTGATGANPISPPPLIEVPTKPNDKRSNRKKKKPKGTNRTGKNQKDDPTLRPPEETAAPVIPGVQPTGGVGNSYPKGKRLRTVEFEAPKTHTPRGNISGKPLCWKFSSNAGCGTRGTECQFGAHKMLKQTGLHWTVRAQIARLGGFKGQPILNEGEINGFIQSLRETDLATSSTKQQDSTNPVNPTGGYCGESPAPPCLNPFLQVPPGLGTTTEEPEP